MVHSIELIRSRWLDRVDRMAADMAFENKFIMPFAFMPAMHMARRLGLIDTLRSNSDLAAIAASSGLRPTGARVLLQLLERAGIVTVTDSHYNVTDLGHRVLTDGDGREFLNPIFRFYELIAPVLSRLPNQADGRNCAFPMDWPPSNPRAAELFESFMTDTAPYVATWLDDLFDWSAVTCALDVGGGDGTVMAMLCARYPSLSATVFNLPWAQSLITATAETHRVTGRLAAHCGDFRHDELPTGYDLVLMA